MTLTYDLSHSTTIVRTIFSLTYNIMQNTICTLGAYIIMYLCNLISHVIYIQIVHVCILIIIFVMQSAA